MRACKPSQAVLQKRHPDWFATLQIERTERIKELRKRVEVEEATIATACMISKAKKWWEITGQEADEILEK